MWTTNYVNNLFDFLVEYFQSRTAESKLLDINSCRAMGPVPGPRAMGLLLSETIKLSKWLGLQRHSNAKHPALIRDHASIRMLNILFFFKFFLTKKNHFFLSDI